MIEAPHLDHGLALGDIHITELESWGRSTLGLVCDNQYRGIVCMRNGVVTSEAQVRAINLDVRRGSGLKRGGDGWWSCSWDSIGTSRHSRWTRLDPWRIEEAKPAGGKEPHSHSPISLDLVLNQY